MLMPERKSPGSLGKRKVGCWDWDGEENGFVGDQKVTLERFSSECRKTKTKVIIPVNHNRHKLSNEPIRTRSKYMLLASSVGKNVRAQASRD